MVALTWLGGVGAWAMHEPFGDPRRSVARGVAIVVTSPELFRVRARTPEQMRLANAFCRFAEMARPPALAADARTAAPAR